MCKLLLCCHNKMASSARVIVRQMGSTFPQNSLFEMCTTSAQLMSWTQELTRTFFVWMQAMRYFFPVPGACFSKTLAPEP